MSFGVVFLVSEMNEMVCMLVGLIEYEVESDLIVCVFCMCSCENVSMMLSVLSVLSVVKVFGIVGVGDWVIF